MSPSDKTRSADKATPYFVPSIFLNVAKTVRKRLGLNLSSLNVSTSAALAVRRNTAEQTQTNKTPALVNTPRFGKSQRC